MHLHEDGTTEEKTSDNQRVRGGEGGKWEGETRMNETHWAITGEGDWRNRGKHRSTGFTLCGFNTRDLSVTIIACNVHHPGCQWGVQACKPISVLIFYALADVQFVFTGANTSRFIFKMRALCSKLFWDLGAGLLFVGPKRCTVACALIDFGGILINMYSVSAGKTTVCPTEAKWCRVYRSANIDRWHGEAEAHYEAGK